MGKGTRNRQVRDVESGVEMVKAAPKKKKTRKPLSNTAKNIIEYAIVLTLVLAIVAGALVSAGTFKRANILVHSQSGKWDLNQQQVTYFIWTDIYQQALQNEYYNAYLQGSSTSMDYSSMMSTAINTAAGTVQYYLSSAINGDAESAGYGEFMKKFVAVLDEADNRGISLSKEEIKTAKDEAVQGIKDMASYFQTTRKSFLKNAVGCNIKMKDIKSLAVMEALYTKVIESKEAELKDALEGVKAETLEEYRENNKESFYYTEYLSYAPKTEETDLIAALDKLVSAEGETTVEEFKTVFAQDVFNTKFESIYNKHNAETDADVLEAALKSQNAESWDAAIQSATEKKLLTAEDTVKEYAKDTQELPEDVTKWFTAEGRQAYDATQIDIKKADSEEIESIYVVVLKEITDTSVKALVKVYNYVDVTTDDYKTFEKNVLNTLLVQFELIEKNDDMTLLDEVEADSTEGKIIDELKTEIEKKFQNAGFTDSSNKEKTNTLYFDADITEDELKAKPYLNWILSAETANGKVNKFDVPETVEGVETTTATYFCIVKSLDYDKSPLVDGGYVEFDSVAAAEEFLASVSGKTGTDLETAFTEKSGTVSTSISEDGLNDELKAWLFDSARAAGNMEVVSSGEKAYVAYFNGSTPTWEANAESSYLEEKLENWINDLSVPYAINEKALKRIKDKPLEEATTTEA